MSTSQDLRRAEDADAGVLHGRFRRQRQLPESRTQSQQVALAVLRAKQGDQEALRYLYVRFADNVYGYVVSLLRDEHDAEDVTQQVFAKLMVVLPRYEQREVPFSAWILRVAHNAAMDAMRRRRAVPFAEIGEPDHRADENMEDRLLGLKEALGALPGEQREVLLLRHVLGLSPAEIARRLGKTESAVHGLHHRGRGTLRAELLKRDSGPAVAAA
jgi:RNA polymerase sigma-70 factor (ECF subfamily)